MKQQPFQVIPMFGPPEPMEMPPSSEIIVPARVIKAMDFLAMLNSKQMTRAACSENQVVEIQGQKLSPEEEATKGVALNMLSHYFEGKLAPDNWETIKADSLVNRNKRKAINGTMRVMSCVHCGGAPGDRKCPLCEGKGTLVVVSGSGGPVKK